MVTGGNGGIGLGFAMGCAKMGGDIAIWARNAEKNAAAKAELLGAGAGRVETYVVDVSTEQAIIDGYGQLMQDFGRIDCVFANSGASPRYNSVFDMPSEHWFEFQKVALHGAFFTLREGARPHEGARRGGRAGRQPGRLRLASRSIRACRARWNMPPPNAAIAAVIRCLAVEMGEYRHPRQCRRARPDHHADDG